MDITSLLTQLVGGAVGGNAAGAALKEKNPGGLINTISGMLGGTALGQGLQSMLGGAGGTDLQSILTNILGGAGGGGILALIVGFVKNKLAAKK